MSTYSRGPRIPTPGPSPARPKWLAAGTATSPGFWPAIQSSWRRFSGRVVIEPFNTTYGVDRDALWLHVAALLQAQGDAWIGISVRAWSSEELKRRDSQRYADVDIGSNDLVWDLLRAIGTLVKTATRTARCVDLPVRHVYLGGYSQSALDTATFAAAFGALTRTATSLVYDGFFPASTRRA